MAQRTPAGRPPARKAAFHTQAGVPEPLGRPNSDRSLQQEELERGLPEDQKRERPDRLTPAGASPRSR